MGVRTTELWNNVGMCCFFAQQYDMALGCLRHALQLASDDAMGDVWYNIGIVAVHVGDIGLAYQANKLAVTCNPELAEAYNNLAALEMYRSNAGQAQSELATAIEQANDTLFEPLYNAAVLKNSTGDFEEAFKLASRALALEPDSVKCMQLLRQLREH